MTSNNKRRNVIIMGAAGRDFHNFNMYFRNNPNYNVVAFTAAQIPGIHKRQYPPELSGKLYPNGIKIYKELELATLVKDFKVDECVLAYSDLSNQEVMEKAGYVLSLGPDFKLMGPDSTMIKSTKPVISICAVRTGVGKSSATRAVTSILKDHGLNLAVIRHPMPYGNLVNQISLRFESEEDFEKYECTLEEREEFEEHIKIGSTVFVGIDYEKILREAEKDADVILWDGGNNDFPFFQSDLLLTLVDPHRPGHELTYYPGTTNVRMANVIIVAKTNTADKDDIAIVQENSKMLNPNAQMIIASSVIETSLEENVRGKSVLVIEDGPTMTHGGMKFGAATLAAKKNGAIIVDPRKYAVGSIKQVYENYKHLGHVLPCMGYSKTQIRELEETINNTPCEFVLTGTPINLGNIIKSNKPIIKVKYEYADNGELRQIINNFVTKYCRKK